MKIHFYILHNVPGGEKGGTTLNLQCKKEKFIEMYYSCVENYVHPLLSRPLSKTAFRKGAKNTFSKFFGYPNKRSSRKSQ